MTEPLRLPHRMTLEDEFLALHAHRERINDRLHELSTMLDGSSSRSLTTPARRKEIYGALHPESVHGNPGVSRQIGDTRERNGASRFTADTAKATGRSERSLTRSDQATTLALSGLRIVASADGGLLCKGGPRT